MQTSRNPFFKEKLPACQLMYGQCVVSWGGGVPQLVYLGGGYPSWSIQGGVHFCVHFWGESTSVFTSGGSHVTYPIMLLYTTIECPSASWAKFTWDPLPQRVGQTDRQTLLKTFPSFTTWQTVNI